MSYRHKEAFKLMLYRCKACGLGEWIWNSRDGVTPFGVDCRRCGEESYHVEWGRDQFSLHYDPKPGDRYFRDGLRAEAVSIMRRRLERARGTKWEMPEEQWGDFIEETVGRSDQPPSEFYPGWPMLITRGTDADTLAQPSTVAPGDGR